MADLVFSNVTVVDGTGGEPYLGDVAVSADRIASIGSPAPAQTGDGAVIDGRGLALAPGFIDVHTHDDVAVMADPDLGCKTLQGVTSVVVGNCGISAAPASDHTRGFTVHERLADYFDAVTESQPAVNVASLVGHGAVRAAVMGLTNGDDPTPADLDAMAERVAAAMDDGAIGMSTGLAYEPGRYSHHEEIVALASIVADAGGIYTTHIRDAADGLLDSIDESIAVADATGIALQISHLKAAGRDNWGRAVDALDRIDAARSRGVDVMADQYPYTRGSTLLEQVISAGALDGPSAFGHAMPEDILIAAAPRHPGWEGHTLPEIAEVEGVAPREMADRIVDAEGRSCFVVLASMDEGDVRRIMAHECVMVGSDGISAGARPHPRLHHTYPRVLGHYVREQGVLGLADAVHRMTAMPAERFGFADRGTIAVGAFADLVLFDPDAIIDTGTYADPTTVPDGVQGVWVNGQRVVDDGHVTGARPGGVIRRER